MISAGVLAELELGFDALLQCRQPKLLEPSRRRTGERLGPKLCERRAAPEAERLGEQRSAASWVALVAGTLDECLEAAEIMIVAACREAVTRRTGLDLPCAERFSQLRDVDLQHLLRARRSALAPQAVDECLDADDPAGVEEEAREQRARLSARQLDRLPVHGCLKRPEQEEAAHARYFRR